MSTAQDSTKKQQQQQQPPRKPKTTRSRNGCWTCRSRKKKCDETRPECMQCLNKGLKCEGYEARLKWGNGIASRGYLKGMNCPVMVVGGGPPPAAATAAETGAGTGAGAGAGAGSAPGKRGARGGRGGGGAKDIHETSSDSDMRGSSGKGSSGESQTETEDSTSPQSTASSSLGPFDQNLMREFKEWGAECLAMGPENGYSPFEAVISYCDESESLMANCLMFQLSLHPEYKERFETYYAEALRLFCRDVCDRINMSKDATLIAGILLASIGMQKCKSWTMHLSGLYMILQHRRAAQNRTPIAFDLVATIGFLDLPSHIVGRQTPALNIWRDYCRGKAGIEPASSMPYSLLDIFSLIAEPDAEWRFWSWNSEGLNAGSNVTTANVRHMLWDAIRSAGIVHTRAKYQQSGTHGGPYGSANDTRTSAPPTEVLADRIMGQLGILYQNCEDVPRTMVNLLLFPTFTVGTQASILSPKHKEFLESFWKEFFCENEGDNSHLQPPLKIMREMWRNPGAKTADQLARDWNVEVGLF